MLRSSNTPQAESNNIFEYQGISIVMVSLPKGDPADYVRSRIGDPDSTYMGDNCKMYFDPHEFGELDTSCEGRFILGSKAVIFAGVQMGADVVVANDSSVGEGSSLKMGVVVEDHAHVGAYNVLEVEVRVTSGTTIPEDQFSPKSERIMIPFQEINNRSLMHVLTTER